MKEYVYEILLRGTPDDGIKVNGCHVIRAVNHEGRDYPSAPVPVNYADLDDLLPVAFAGMIDQVAKAEAARDAALGDLARVQDERDGLAEVVATLEARVEELVKALTSAQAPAETPPEPQA